MQTARLEMKETRAPACQAAHPSLCSQCSQAYDCQRIRDGRSWSWGVVALLLLVGLAAVL